MVYLLRWSTFVILILVVIGAAVNYPLLRARFYASMPVSPAATFTPARQTLPAAAHTAPSPTSAPDRTPLESSPDHQANETIAATSLPPMAVTPLVLGPSIAGIATPSSSAIHAAPGVLPGNSLEPAGSLIVDGDAPDATVELIPSAMVPTAASRREYSAAPAIKIAPQILPDVTTVAATSPTPTLPPQGSTARVTSKLYLRPDRAAHTDKQVLRGEALFVVGLYTEGNWLLLFDGMWIPADAVDNAPLVLPLVFPTMTPPP
jgi:hypothetical protein